jgi:hypothetical protein
MGADQGAMEKDRMGVEVQLPSSNVLIATKGLHPIPNANRAARGAISLLGKKGEANIDTESQMELQDSIICTEIHGVKTN